MVRTGGSINGAFNYIGVVICFRYYAMFYAIVLGWVGLQIYLLYESDFDFHVTFPMVTLHLTLLYLAIKQGWFRGNE